MVNGLKHGQSKTYSESGEIVLVLNYIEDELDQRDKEKQWEYLNKKFQ